MLQWAQRGTEGDAELEYHGVCHDIPEGTWVCRGYRGIHESIAEWCRAKHTGVQKVAQSGVYRDTGLSTEWARRGKERHAKGSGVAQSFEFKKYSGSAHCMVESN